MTLLAGRYRVEREVGRGAMGVVFLAYDERLDRRVALKELLPYGHLTPELQRELAGRFDHEARAAGRLNHPSIVSVYDVFVDDDHSYIVMEYVEGETLDAILARGPLEPDGACAIAIQVLQAVGHAHASAVIHRDLKPENVFVQPNGAVKVTDFGIAHIGDTSASWTRAGTIVGTVGYMSPEQLRGESVDQRTDVFAVGVLLYEMLTGVNPFGNDAQTAVMYRIAHEEPPPLRAVRTGAPKYLDAIVRKALHKDRDQRYQSTADMVADIVNRRSPKVRPATIPPPPPVYAPVQPEAPTPSASRSMPTVIGQEAPASAGGQVTDGAAAVALPADAVAPAGQWPPAGGFDGLSTLDEPSGGASRFRTGGLIALVAAAVAVAIIAGVFVLSSRGVTATTGSSVSNDALISDARMLKDLQNTLATAASGYGDAVDRVNALAKKNNVAVEKWKEDLPDYEKAYEKAVAAREYNASEMAKKSSGSTTAIYRTETRTNPVNGDITVVRVFDHNETTPGYTPKHKDVPSVPAKPSTPTVKIAPVKKQVSEVRASLRRLNQLASGVQVDSRLTPVLEAIRTEATALGGAARDLRDALNDGVQREKFRDKTYQVLPAATLAGIAPAAPHQEAAKAVWQSLLAALGASGLSAADLRASKSPSASLSPSPSVQASP